MKKTYQVESKLLATQLQFTYSNQGTLVGFRVVDDVLIAPKTVAGILENALTLDLLKTYAQGKNMPVVEVPTDISFKVFWEAYNYKEAGDKKDAQKKWDLLDETEKVNALLYIKKYNAHQLNSGAARLYAKTYLNQKRWNNG